MASVVGQKYVVSKRCGAVNRRGGLCARPEGHTGHHLREAVGRRIRTDRDRERDTARRHDPELRDFWRQKDRRYALKHEFGLTLEEYNEMILAQGGKCAACGRPSKLHVDHDHRSGRVRGLLCGPCNRALGFLESPLRSAWEAYLRGGLNGSQTS